MTYAIFSGSFDPPNLSHLKVLQGCLKEGCSKVYLVVKKKSETLEDHEKAIADFFSKYGDRFVVTFEKKQTVLSEIKRQEPDARVFKVKRIANEWCLFDSKTIPKEAECIPIKVLEPERPAPESLPVVTVPEENIKLAENEGVKAGLRSLFLPDQPVLNASYAIYLMEILHKDRYVAKVNVFACLFGEGFKLVNSLESKALKCEFLIRLAKLADCEERKVQWRNFAADILNNTKEAVYCHPNNLNQLAFLYAETLDLVQTVYWLKKAGSSKEACRNATELFFYQGSFEVGLELLRKFDLLPLKTPSNQFDFVACIAHLLKNPCKDQEIQLFLHHCQNNEKQVTTLLKALSHVKKFDDALRLAEKLALKNDRIDYLMKIADYHMNESERRQNYLKLLRKVANRLSSPTMAFSAICCDGSFSFAEDIETIKFLKSNSGKLKILNSLRIKNKESFHHLHCLNEMRKQLSVSSEADVESHPPYWVTVLEEYIRNGLPDEALKTGEMWKKWRLTQNQGLTKGKDQSWIQFYILSLFNYIKRLWSQWRAPSLKFNAEGPLWFQATFGVFELAMGKGKEGLEDLKMAYELQKADRKKCPTVYNNFYSMVENAIFDSCRYIENSRFNSKREDFIRAMHTISDKSFDYQSMEDLVKKYQICR